MSAVIGIERVTKTFGPVVAVDDVSLEIRENEFFALLGPSGCGKTTLLRLIAGFEEPDKGRILLDGRDVTAVRPNHRPINMMFQSYALFPHMSVAANVAYGLRMDGVRGAELKSQVSEALAMVRLTEVADRKPHRLSGGQRQRVALARALVKRPRLLLLDEPLAALDKKLREEMQFELKKLQHEVGIAFLVVTHDQAEALALADRIALLNTGRVEQLGAATDLYERPGSHFVADFIGSMNFFPGRRVAGGVEVEGLGLLKGEGMVAEGATAWYAVRPEKIALSAAPPEGADNAVEGTVAGVTYLGQDFTVFVRVTGMDKPLTVRLTSGTDIALTEGARLWCSWSASAGRMLVRENDPKR